MTALRKPPLSIVGKEPETDENQRILEAILFASAEPVDEKLFVSRLPEGTDLNAELKKLGDHYAARGVNLVRVAGKWALRTASDLGHRIARDTPPPRKLSRAAIETLAIVAYHQPVTRAEIEEIRGVTINTGTLDVLIQTGWVRLRGRRKVPGRPVTYGTTEQFLIHFGLDQIDDLPGLDELKGAGFLDDRLPAGFSVPIPNDVSTLRDDEEPLEEGDPALDPEAK
ncbi:MAG: SMC-Scp complex subunit ScpB [Xanthobacteraceae bacterium]|nr:SMC-Scp complex subunit ScpB [Xanthobacteraceae bacterium]